MTDSFLKWLYVSLVAGMLLVSVVACTAQAQAEAQAKARAAVSAGTSTFERCAVLYSTSSAMDPFVEPVPYLEGLGFACGPATVEAVIASLESASSSLPDAGADAAAPLDVTQAARLSKAHRLAKSAQLAARVSQ